MAKLAAYLAKRDFGRTSEPKGDGAEAAGGSAFVVQKHDATRLHYDLRLELDGVMKSWAVAKGPSLVPGDKRLAIHTEDHPLDYNGFEGTIPKGQYGGGTVMIWDRGSWTPAADPRRGYKKGHLDFSLDGEKLRGAFHLVRMRKKAGEKQEPWLLIKSDDDHARTADDPDILDEQPLSVATGRDLAAIAAAPDGAVCNSNHGLAADERAAKVKPATARARKAATPPAILTHGGETAAMPQAIEPCLATLVDDVPGGAGWIHEIKWDGYRLIAFKARGKARIATRRGHDWTARFPGIAEAVAALPVETAILDGEAVIEDEGGVPSFSALQNALSDEHGGVARDAVLQAFDLLYLDGRDLCPLPLEDRKARLAAIVPAGAGGRLRLSEHIEADGKAMLRNACRLGLEGVISKRRDRPYRSGRGQDWVKVKCTDRQEFIVAGYAPSKAGQRAVGSLVLAYNEDGALRHAGRAGTGFTADSARALFRLLDPTKRPTSPFPKRLTAEERRGVVWVDPTQVAEVEFRGWTADGHLRHAAFKGLRDDKPAAEIVRERPAHAGETAAAAEPPRSTPRFPRKASAKGGLVAGVALTNSDRVLWEGGITKRDLATFYEDIADWILPQLHRRPLSLVRCPSGAEHGCFFQKHAWAGLGEHIRSETIRDADGEDEVLFVDSIAGVVSLVQAGVLEIHPWGSRMDHLDLPDRIVMDLDPGEDVAWPAVIAGARDVRERLRSVGLESFVKTTGGKGLHVVVPLRPVAGWAEVKAFAKALADEMERDRPRDYVAKAAKQARRGRIYVDYLRNGRGATAISAYSTRARPDAPVAVPVGWDELKPALKPNGFTLRNLKKRLDRAEDPWAEMDTVDQALPTSAKPTTTRKRSG